MELPKDPWGLRSVGMRSGASQPLEHTMGAQAKSVSSVDVQKQPSVTSRNRARSFLEEERDTARYAARFCRASGGWENPVALWILGPSAVGKSTQSNLRAKNFGIPDLADGPDAVIVDGEFFRETHQAYQAWTQTEDWKAAYPAVKSHINQEKAVMLKEARKAKKHLIIPQTCLDLRSCLDEVQDLTEGGYINHVLVITAPREEVARRGAERAARDKKVYNPTEFDKAIAGIEPMLQKCNGRYQKLYVKEELQGNGATFVVTDAGEGYCGGAEEPNTSERTLT